MASLRSFNTNDDDAEGIQLWVEKETRTLIRIFVVEESQTPS